MEHAISTIPASAIIPTANRPAVLLSTFKSIAKQQIQPFEIIVIDASPGDETFEICSAPIEGLMAEVRYARATVKGAAVQRMQAYEISSQPFILFMDDDILLEPGCIGELWNCISQLSHAGAVNAMITNQQYHDPGKATRFMYRLMSGVSVNSYAGKCIGPAWNLLPQDAGARVNETEWLNSGCTLYRREALPTPLFPPLFMGYSLMEDLALSLTIAKNWKLYNVRTAKIFHDSQPGTHKRSVFKISKMEFTNRHYIMVNILNRTGLKNHLKLILFELWGLYPKLRSVRGLKELFPDIAGKFAASFSLMFKTK